MIQSVFSRREGTSVAAARAVIAITVTLISTLALALPKEREPREPDARAPAGGNINAPTRLWAAQTSATEITLVWTAVPSAAEYRLYAEPRFAGRPGGPDAVISGNGSRYVVNRVAPNQSYRFAIEAVDRQGRVSPRAQFNPVTVQTPAAGTLAPPAGVNAAQSAPDEITLSWNAVPGATAYAIGRAVGPSGLQVLCGICPADSKFIDRNIQAGARHVYTVTAIAPNGRSTAARSNEVTPGSTTAGTSGGGTAGGTGGGTVAATPNESRRAMVERAFRDGGQRNPSYANSADRNTWLALAEKSGMSYEELVASWPAIYVVHYAFQHLLGRQPNADEIKKYAAKVPAANNWHPFWRELATSPERDQKFGYYAPAPFTTANDAAKAFGLKSPRGPEQCFGGIGDKCEGGVPPVYPGVQPRWINEFTLPDGTRMGWVELGVAVGSVLHDNACLADRSGLNCNGIGGGDLIKTGSWPAGLEWNKAGWNVIDSRFWRERFGPYPVDKNARRTGWYDDVRPMLAREAWMAPAVSMITIPLHTERYKGAETKASRHLKAPRWTTLDGKDQQFCASGVFEVRGETPLKAPWGNCR